jgi:RND family efflux transporter MFP subunit
LLFRIDQRPFAAELERAEATARQLATRFERLTRQEERMTRLADQKVTTAEELDQVKYLRMETEAELKAAKASVDLARLDLEFTEIKAPFAGRIGRRLVDPGNLVVANDTVLATIVSLDPIYAYFDIDERTVLQLRRMIAEGKLDSAEDRAIPIQLALADQEEFSLAGLVNFVDNQLSATTGTLRLRADVQNPNKLLSPGMYVRIRVPIGDAREAALIPEEALGSDQGQRFVYVLNDNDEVEYRRIKTGRIHRGYRVVESGLSTDDRVIVKGLQRVRPGLKVSPKVLEQNVAQAAPAPGPATEILVQTPRADSVPPSDDRAAE